MKYRVIYMVTKNGWRLDPVAVSQEQAKCTFALHKKGRNLQLTKQLLVFKERLR
jgi:hypothetical protein